MKEDLNWKQLIDGFQHGFLLYKKDQIFYKNEAAIQTLGLDKIDDQSKIKIKKLKINEDNDLILKQLPEYNENKFILESFYKEE